MKLKILLVDYMDVLTPGGINTTVREIAKHLAKNGHDVYVFTQSMTRGNIILKYGNLFIVKGRKYFNLPYGFNLMNLVLLIKTINQTKPDIIHIHGYQNPFPLFAVFLTKIICKRIPIILSPHFAIYGHSTLLGKYLFRIYNITIGRKLANTVDAIIFSSLFEKKTFLNEMKEVKARMHYIPHGVSYSGDECYFHEKVNDRELEKGELKILYIGYLYKYKGVQDAIKALAKLINNYKMRARLLVIGDGPYKKELIKLAVDLGLEKSIEWLGFQRRQQLINHICSADVLVFPSEGEMFGLVAYEALKLGLPVIAKKRGALIECIARFKCCHGANSPDEIAETILKLACGSRKESCEEDSRRIKTWKQVAEEYEKVYYELIKWKKLRFLSSHSR